MFIVLLIEPKDGMCEPLATMSRGLGVVGEEVALVEVGHRET